MRLQPCTLENQCHTTRSCHKQLGRGVAVLLLPPPPPPPLPPPRPTSKWRFLSASSCGRSTASILSEVTRFAWVNAILVQQAAECGRVLTGRRGGQGRRRRYAALRWRLPPRRRFAEVACSAPIPDRGRKGWPVDARGDARAGVDALRSCGPRHGMTRPFWGPHTGHDHAGC